MSTDNQPQSSENILDLLHNLAVSAQAIDSATAPKSAAERWELQVAAYELEATRAFESLRISALGGGVDSDAAFTLSRLYVEPAGEAAKFYMSNATDRQGDTQILKDNSAVPSAVAYLRHPYHPRHILLGAAGTGKSSVLRFLYLDWANKRRAGVDAGPVPILVEVREFLGACEATRNVPPGQRVTTILEYLTVGHGRGWRFDEDTLLAALREQRAMLLVDGLDEAFEEKPRNDLGDWLRGFAKKMPNTRIVATSRVIGFRDAEWPRNDLPSEDPRWQIQTLVPFDRTRIDLFIDRWFAAEVPGFHTSAVIRDEVRRLIHELPFLQPLAEVPLTLTMLCAVGQRGIRPDNRISVFAEAAKIFLLQWDNARGLPKEEARIVAKFREYGEVARLHFFQSVALCMIAGGDVNNSNRISRDALRGILLEQFANLDAEQRDWLADGLLRLMCERNFLLTELPGGGYAFFHRSFLEYFTALAWAEQFGNDAYEDPSGDKPSHRVFFEEVIEPRWEDATWHDTLRFLFGLLRPVPALRCLELLAEKEAEVAAHPENKVEPVGLVYAVDFLQEVEASFSQGEAGKKKPGGPLSRSTLAERWKTRVLEFARTKGGLMPEQIELRRRAVVALAGSLRGNREFAQELLASLRVKVDMSDLDRAVGAALAVVAPGKSEEFWLLVGVMRGPFGVPPLGGNHDGTQERGAIPPKGGTPNRAAAVSALAGGWPGDADAKAALLLVLQGVPEAGKAPSAQAIPPDADDDVRNQAAWELGRGWRGDAEVKAALLRALIGVPEAGKAPSAQTVPPDSYQYVRSNAARRLGEGWCGDAEVHAALTRVATGTLADGSAFEKNKDVRDFTNIGLDNWTK